MIGPHWSATSLPPSLRPSIKTVGPRPKVSARPTTRASQLCSSRWVMARSGARLVSHSDGSDRPSLPPNASTGRSGRRGPAHRRHAAWPFRGHGASPRSLRSGRGPVGTRASAPEAAQARGVLQERRPRSQCLHHLGLIRGRVEHLGGAGQESWLLLWLSELLDAAEHEQVRARQRQREKLRSRAGLTVG